MEQEKQKKSTFEKVVIVFNIIAAFFMIVTIIKFGIVEECTQSHQGMSEAEMELSSFNSKFTTYEGIITGSQIKGLVAIVNTNNGTYDGTELVVSINGRTNENQYTCNVGSAKKYKVEIEYDNGVVSNINIYKTTTQNENNNVSTNYTEFADITGYMQEGSIGKVYTETKEENIEENDVEYIINWYIIVPFIIILILYFTVYIYSKSTKKRILKECNEEKVIQKRFNETRTVVLYAYFIISILTVLIYCFLMQAINFAISAGSEGVEKPIIYIYSEEEIKVTVELGKKENLTCTYPLYEDKWEIIAEPDGTLIDEETGRTYYALYWEGVNSKKYSNKLEDGFVVKGEDTAKFLEEKLEILGLNEREAEEFIVYWLPKMQDNKYNYIRFQTIEEINENMSIEITPEPETLIRVMMEWKGLDKYVEVEEQQLEKVERKGYTVVEWGGTEIK